MLAALRAANEPKACPERRSRSDRSRMGTCICLSPCIRAWLPAKPHPPQPTEGAWGFSPTKPHPRVLQRIKYAAKPRPITGAHATAHSPHPSHAQRSPQADFPGVILLRPARPSGRSPQRGRNTLAPVVRLGVTERPRVSARLSGRKKHCARIPSSCIRAWLQPSRTRPNPRRERGASAPRNPAHPSFKESKYAAKPRPNTGAYGIAQPRTLHTHKGHHNPTFRA